MSHALFDLTGRRALITGSSQGIGFALAQGLQAAGAQVVLNGRDAAKLAEAAARIPGADTLAFDATDHAAVRPGGVAGHEAVVAGTAAEVEHGVTGLYLCELRWESTT